MKTKSSSYQQSTKRLSDSWRGSSISDFTHWQQKGIFNKWRSSIRGSSDKKFNIRVSSWWILQFVHFFAVVFRCDLLKTRVCLSNNLRIIFLLSFPLKAFPKAAEWIIHSFPSSKVVFFVVSNTTSKFQTLNSIFPWEAIYSWITADRGNLSSLINK